jgi:hypothetical protein
MTEDDDWVSLATEPHTTRELINDLRVAIAEAPENDIRASLDNLAQACGYRLTSTKYAAAIDEALRLMRRDSDLSAWDAATKVAGKSGGDERTFLRVQDAVYRALK